MFFKRIFCLILIIICFCSVNVFADEIDIIDNESIIVEETEIILEENLETDVLSVSNDVEIELLKSIDSSFKYIINTFQGFMILCFFVLLYKLIFKLFAYCIF